jgi:hypothetical protein
MGRGRGKRGYWGDEEYWEWSGFHVFLGSLVFQRWGRGKREYRGDEEY